MRTKTQAKIGGEGREGRETDTKRNRDRHTDRDTETEREDERERQPVSPFCSPGRRGYHPTPR